MYKLLKVFIAEGGFYVLGRHRCRRSSHVYPSIRFNSKSRDNKQRNLFGILLNQPKIRLYLPFPTDLEPSGHPFGSKSIEKW